MSTSMSREERQEFLAGVHVGVLAVASADGRGPLTVPVWYVYRSGGTVDVITGDETRKAAAIRAAGRFSLCAQEEQPPYKYVTVEGPVTIEQASHDERLGMARRYLGVEGGDWYVTANPTSGQIVFRMTPEHWLAVDYGKVYGQGGSVS
jgi:PPOX class probable F420-dependent enzyme